MSGDLTKVKDSQVIHIYVRTCVCVCVCVCVCQGCVCDMICVWYDVWVNMRHPIPKCMQYNSYCVSLWYTPAALQIKASISLMCLTHPRPLQHVPMHPTPEHIFSPCTCQPRQQRALGSLFSRSRFSLLSPQHRECDFQFMFSAENRILLFYRSKAHSGCIFLLALYRL